MQENDSCGTVIHMGYVQGSEKVQDTMHVGMMARGFNALGCCCCCCY
jgi:hypothetical protein